MREECEASMAEALGRDLKPTEAREAEDAVSLQMRLLGRKDPQTWLALSAPQRLERAATAAAQSIVSDLKLKQRRVELQIAAHDRIEDTLHRAFDQIEARGVRPGAKLNAVSQLLAFDPVGHNITSAETWSHAIGNEALGRLVPLWNAVKGFAHLFENQKGVSDLVHELFGEGTGNLAAREGVSAWLRVTDELRDRANAAGMDVGKLDEWHYPQSHSQARVAGAGRTVEQALEKWAGDTLPLLDRSKYLHADGTRFSDAEMVDFLHHAFDSIVTDGQNRVLNEYNPERGTLQQSYGIGAIANRDGAHRAIFFRNADAYLTYQGLYGERNLWSVLTGHVRAIARDIGLVESLGPNAEQTFRYFNERTLLEELRAHPAAATKIRSQAALNESIFDYVSGKRAVVNDKIAAIGQAWRNFETATKLGRVVITALGDEAGMSATAFANHVPWSEALLRELTYLNPANGADRDVAARAGLGINGMIGGLNRFGYEDLQLAGGDGRAAGVRNFTSKLATGVLQASGAETMWDARRRALGSVLMSYLGKWTREAEHFGDVNAQDHGILASKGITENDWQVWRRAELEDWGMKHGVLTPKSVYAIPDEKIDEVIRPEIDRIRSEAAGRLRELQARDAQEQQWMGTRADELSAWLKGAQEKVAARIAKSDAGVKAALEGIASRISKMQEQLEYAGSYWKNPVDENTPGIANRETVGFYGKGQLRSLGVEEGRAQEAIRSLNANARELSRSMEGFKVGQLEQLADEYHSRRQELDEFTQRAQTRMAVRGQIADRLQASIEPRIAQARMAARRHASTMLLGHILEETGMGVMDTGARERARMLFGTTAGTAAGELTRSVFLFKSFAFSMMMKHWARAAAMPTGTATAAYVARLVVAGTIMGALANQLRDLASGKNPSNIAEPQFWGESFLRGGGLGFYGDFLYDELTSHDTSLIPALLGPLATNAEEMWNLTGAAAFKHARGEQVDEGAKLVRFARGNIPFLNVWYTQAAFDHLIWNQMQEAASPGYLERMQAKAYAQRGTSWWWNPAESTPASAPDLAKAWQPELGQRQLEVIADRLAQETGQQ